MRISATTGAVATVPVVPQEQPEEELVIQNLSAFKRLSRAFTRGALTHEAGHLGYEMMGSPGPEVARQQEEISNRITELGDDGPGFVGWLGSAAEIAGQQYASMVAPFGEAKEAFADLGNVTEAPLQKIGRAAGAVQGLLAPPVAFTMDAFKVEGGHSYVESIEAGVDPNIARLTAHVVGTINAGLEAAGLTGAAAPLATATKNLLKVGVRKVASDPRVLGAAARVVGAYGAGIGSEVATELLQESVTIAATEIGKQFTSEQLEAMTAEEIQERLVGVAVKTFKGMSVLAAPGAAAQFGVEVQRARAAKTTAANLEAIKKVLDEAPDPVIAGEQLTTSLVEAGTDHVFISADAIVEEARKSGDAPAYYATLGVGNQIEEAALLGGDVRIDVKKGVELMQSDLWSGLKDHIRLAEEDMSPAEAAEFEQAGLDEEIAELDKLQEPEFVTLEEGRSEGLDKFGEPDERGMRERVGIPAVVIDGQTFTAHDHTTAIDQAIVTLGPEIAARIDANPEQFVGFVRRQPSTERQAEIDEAQFGLQAFFKDAKDAGMTDKQYETYLGSLQKAADSKNSAKERIRLRKLERETREEIKTIKAQLAEVARESVDNQPVYGAINALEGRERLNKEKLESLGIDPASLPKSRGRQIYEKGGTVDPEVFAELWGFEGADIMAFAMMDAIPREAAIAQETERLFNEQYVGLNQKQQEIEADIEALHNDSQATVIALELNQLREAVGQKKLKPRLLKVAARDRLRDFSLKEINPKKYLAAERREARTAAKLLRKGDRQGAAKAKFRQLLNFQFAMEAYRVREKTKAQHKYFKKFLRKAKPNAKLPIDYLEAIRTMLGEIDFKRSRPSLVDFVVSKQVNEGIVLNIPMQVQVDNGKTSYLDLSLRRWEQMYEAVKEVEKKGLDENKFLREQEKQTRDEKAGEMAANVLANLKDVSGETIVPSRWEAAVRNGRDLGLNMTNVESIARQVDGYEELGAAHNAIVKPYFDAMINGYQPGQVGYIPRHKKEAKRLNELISVFTKKEQREAKKPIVIPGIRTGGKHKMSRERMLMTLANLGNLENRKAIVDSEQFTEAELDTITNYASKKDWDFVQSVWDYFEEFWPEVVESSKRRRNVIPEKVEATPVETPHGTYRGGYFPLMYDFDEVTMTRAALESDVAKLVESQKLGGYVQTQTRHGHTLDREANAKRAVRLDLFNINSHINQVIYDLEVGDAAMDIYKMLYHPQVTQAFRSIGQQQRWEQLSVWFGDVVLGEKHFQDIVSRTFRYMRTGFVISNIGFNPITVLLQPLGLVNTAVQLGKFNTLIAMSSAAFNPRAAWYISTATPFMEQRAATYNHDIMQAETAFKNSIARRVPGLELAGSFAFYALIKMQKVVDTITFMAAQRKGMKDFNGDLNKANEFADNMVARSQSSGVFGLRTPLERGTTARRYQQNEVVKALVPFMSYFLAKANIAYERTKKTNPRSPTQVIHLIFDLAMLTLFEQLLAAMLFGDWPEDEDDLPGFAAWQIVKSTSAMFPGVRDMVSFAEGFTGGGVTASIANQAGNFLKQASQGEIDGALVRSGARITGTLARIPGTSTGLRLERAIEAESENPMDYLRGPKP